MKPTIVQIYFFDGSLVRTENVDHAKLPGLSAERTFWRESMSEDELAKRLKARIGRKMAKMAKVASKTA